MMIGSASKTNQNPFIQTPAGFSRRKAKLSSIRHGKETQLRSNIKLERINEEARGLTLDSQINLRDRIDSNIQEKKSQRQAVESAIDDARREKIRRAKGSMIGLLPSVETFLLEKHAEIEEEHEFYRETKVSLENQE